MPNSGRFFSIALACILAAQVGYSQASAAPVAPTETPRPRREPPPTRDPHTPGYVKATELPDGAVPDPKKNGNFIIGPTHTPAPEEADPNRQLEGTVVEFTMDSRDSKYYPGIARNPDSHATPDPAKPAHLLGIETHPQPYVRKVAVYVPKSYVPGTEAPFIVGADGPTGCFLQRWMV